MGDIQVVIIEDHSLTRIGMRSSLNEQEGIQVVGDEATASDGLKLLQSTKPDIAIIDIGLPDRDGIWLVQQFRESLVSETAQTKVMMLTSFAKEQMVLAAFAAGADSYCVKTIKFELLLEALHITHEVSRGLTQRSLVLFSSILVNLRRLW